MIYQENTTTHRLEEIQAILNSKRPLSLDRLDPSKMKGKSHKEGLKYLIKQSYKRDTLEGIHKTKIQCSSMARRSAGDLYRLMRTYYPKITYAKTRKLLLELISEHFISSNHCRDIRKRVYWSPGLMYDWWDFGGGTYSDPNYPDEFKCTVSRI